MHRFVSHLTTHRASGGASSASRLAGATLLAAAACLAMTPAHAVTIDWVTVGDPGNAADTLGNRSGAVSYEYRIGKYHVTIQQYTDFLNAVAKSDPYLLWNSQMTILNVAGISRTGTSGSYSYSVIGSSGNKPVTFVSWFDAARFANWMQNGQGTGSTETGAYTLSGTTSGNAVARNSGATFYIPTENESYKAAYFSPVKGGVGSPGYYAFATQSDTAPGNVVGSGANQANWKKDNLYSVTQSSSYSSSQNYLTDVGAFTNSASYYGTFDQTGNVRSWNDLDGTAGSYRGYAGGSWNTSLVHMLRASYGSVLDVPSNAGADVGFRLASPVAVPEPSTWVMAAGGFACAACGAWRRRQSHR